MLGIIQRARVVQAAILLFTTSPKFDGILHLKPFIVEPDAALMSKKELLQQGASIKLTAAQVAQGSAKSRKFESITSRADLAPLPTLAIATLIAQSDLIGIDGRDSTVIKLATRKERKPDFASLRFYSAQFTAFSPSRPAPSEFERDTYESIRRVLQCLKASQPIFGEEGELSRLVDPSEVDP